MNVTELRPGNYFEDENTLYQVIDILLNKTAMRKMVAKVKVRNVRTGAITELARNSGYDVTLVSVDKKQMQYLYDGGTTLVFMDPDTYEQVELPKTGLEREMGFLAPNGFVTINAYDNSVDYHGGIVGCNYEKIIGCISSATVSHNGHSSCSSFGAIAGQNHRTIENCLALGATVSAYSCRGVIAGSSSNTLANNYYYNCTVSSKTTNIGKGSGIDTSDVSTNDGAVEASSVLSDSETVPTELSGKVVFRREFTGGKASTVIFPFAHEKGTEGTYYTFGGVQYDGTEGKWKATMNEYAGATLAANTPYLFVPAGSEAHAPVLFHGTADYHAAGTTVNGDWSFKGVYETKVWTAGDVGNDYGFAATSGKAVDGVTDVNAGDFVKLAAGAWIRPMRSYLTYTGGSDPWAAPSHHAASTTELPGRISVILVSANGSTTEIAEMRNEELEMINGNEEMKNGWYTLDGRKLDKLPTTKGIYVNNGRKTVIK